MTNIVLFRLAGDGSTWIADLEAGTVERADDFDIEQESGGVDYAVAATARSDAASHNLYRDGVEFAVAAKVRSEAASHQYFPSR